MHGRRYLGCDFMVGKRTNEAYSGAWRAHRYFFKIWMLRLFRICESVEPSGNSYDPPRFAQGIKRIGMNPALNQIAGAKSTAVLAECLNSTIQIPGLHTRVIIAPHLFNWVYFYPKHLGYP